MGDTGLEHPRHNTGKTAILPTGGAQSGARADVELAEVVRRWPTLRASARAAVLALVRRGAARVV